VRPRVDLSGWINRLLILAGAAVVVAAGVQAWLVLDGLPVAQIRVTGDVEKLQREEVQAQVQPALAGGFLSADLARIRAGLETLPWVYQATVRRRWPDALEIHVVEQLPIARWGDGAFLNHSGEVFQPGRAGDWDALPALSGPAGSTRELMTHYLRLRELLRPLELSVRALDIDRRGQLLATLDGGMQLALGNRAVIERVQRFVAVYPRHLAPQQGGIERVDLRYASGLAVSFRAAEQTEPASQLAGL
jgi:cell division protein FtsQ